MTQSFHNVRFPTGISLKASGGPERRTQIVQLASGHEERNTRWADSRRRYNAGFGIGSLDDLQQVISFFEERRGRLYGFLWKDHADWKSCPPSKTPDKEDQLLGVGDGSASQFFLTKNYGAQFNPYARRITRPVAGTVVVGVNGFAQTQGTDYSLDTQTGEISFLPGAVPPNGASVTAGFEFDVPVRFDTDFLEINLEAFTAGQIPDIEIIEIKQ